MIFTSIKLAQNLSYICHKHDILVDTKPSPWPNSRMYNNHENHGKELTLPLQRDQKGTFTIKAKVCLVPHKGLKYNEIIDTGTVLLAM